MARWQALVVLCGCWSSLPTSVAAQTRVACVGDSITEGYGLGSPQQDAYPAQLQGMLGSEYEVENFGVSGTTARKQGDKPYWNQGAYTQSTNFDANVVLLMLGTNDAKPTNWNEASFRADYAELVAHYVGLGARVFVATPPKVFGNGAFDISPTTVNETLVPLVRGLAPQVDATLVDVFAATEAHAAWFPDNIHPSREGARLLAETFAAALTAPVDTTEAVGNASTSSSGEASLAPSSESSSDAASSAPETNVAASSEPASSEPGATAPATTSTPTSSATGDDVSPSSTGPSSTAPSSTAPTPTASPSVSNVPSTAASTPTMGTDATPPAQTAPRERSSCDVRHVGSTRGGAWALLLGAACAVATRRARRRIELPRL